MRHMKSEYPRHDGSHIVCMVIHYETLPFCKTFHLIMIINVYYTRGGGVGVDWGKCRVRNLCAK